MYCVPAQELQVLKDDLVHFIGFYGSVQVSRREAKQLFKIPCVIQRMSDTDPLSRLLSRLFVSPSDQGTSIGVKFLSSLVGLCAGVLAVIGGMIATDQTLTTISLGTLLLIVFLIGFGLIMFILAGGLWIGIEWAWSWALILYAGSAIGGFVASIQTLNHVALLSAGISGVIAVYLYSQQDQFKDARQQVG